MAANSHSSNAYTDQEKKFLVGPLVIGTIVVTVFLYVYSTIPSRPYELHEASHGAAQHEAGHGAAPAAGHEAKH